MKYLPITDKRIWVVGRRRTSRTKLLTHIPVFNHARKVVWTELSVFIPPNFNLI